MCDIVTIVGDGFINAQAITKGDVGIPIGSGADIAIAATPIALINKDHHQVTKQ